MTKNITKTFVQVYMTDANDNDGVWKDIDGNWKHALYLMKTNPFIKSARLNVKTFNTVTFTVTENVIRITSKF